MCRFFLAQTFARKQVNSALICIASDAKTDHNETNWLTPGLFVISASFIFIPSVLLQVESMRIVTKRTAGRLLGKTTIKAFTLVELLVVIAIIGVLVALLLPAVQAAREAARRMQCQNNLKQMGLGSLNHESTNRFYPSGGWSYNWGPDPDRGFGRNQPAGWMYSLLPFIEQGNLRDLGSGQAYGSSGRQAALTQLIQTPVGAYLCPSRGITQLPLTRWNSPVNNMGAYPRQLGESTGLFRGDYAANAGTTQFWDGATWFKSNGPKALSGDYAAAEAGFQKQLDSVPMDFCETPTTGLELNWSRHCQDGTVFVRSEVKVQQIEDGTSNTYLIGEKHINPDEYAGGTSTNSPQLSFNTNQAAYCGYEWDNYKVAWSFLTDVEENQEDFQPRPDTPGLKETKIWGSAHPGGFNMVYCDGSVHSVNYDVDPFVHSYRSSRNDGRVIAE